jgi:VWFA-related protein
MKRVYRALLIVLLLASLTVPALAADDFRVTFQVDASAYPLFNLYVTVMDASGQPVQGLTADNFQVTEDGQPVKIESFAGIGDPRPVDIVFVFDVTGSMQDKIDSVKETCVRFADKLKQSGRDYRLGLVAFLDVIDATYRPDGSLTPEVQEFKRWISGLTAHGGDDGPELSLDALLQGAKMNFRDKAQHILILITDAPPHHRADGSGLSRLTFDDTITQLTKDNATVYAVGPNIAELPEEDNGLANKPGRYGLPARNEYERLAQERGGKFYDINRNADFTGLINDIGATIASQYRLAYHTLRPTPDGTLRGIAVTVSREGRSGGGTGAYLEPHLLNITSNLAIGLAFLIVLVGAAVVPMALKQRAPAATSAPSAAWTPPPAPPNYAPAPVNPRVPTMPFAPPAPPPAVAQPTVCLYCRAPLKPGAKFCNKCGATQTIAPPVAPPVIAAQPAVCPQCGAPLRPGAKFCAKCGRGL